MTKKCKGCGVEMQSDDKNALGYTPKEDADYCQRCFRLRHYGDVTINMQQGIEANKTFDQIAKLDALVCYVCDVFDLEDDLISRLNQKLDGKELLLVITKRDLLPDTFSNERLAHYLQQRLAQEGIKVKDIVICGHMNTNYEESKDALLDLMESIEAYRNGRDVVFMGVANAGKSTLINRLLSSSELTVSRNPGTTLDLVKIELPYFTLYDTPGIENHHSVLSWLDAKDLKNVIPSAQIRPRVFQIHQDQSFAIGGLARMDVTVKGDASVTAYFSRELDVHRGKLEKADELWQKHFGKDFVPTISKSLSDFQTFTAPKMEKGTKMDVVIHGLGWFCLSGDVKSVSVRVPKGIYVTFRKAMI
jgi:hypothetical protein